MFYEWVTTRRAGDNPRGDFIRDTRDTFKTGGESHCAGMMGGACREAKHERDLLKREYHRLGSPVPTRKREEHRTHGD